MIRSLMLTVALLWLFGCGASDSISYSASEVSGVDDAIRDYYFPEDEPPFFTEYQSFAEYQDGVNDVIYGYYFPAQQRGTLGGGCHGRLRPY